MLGLLLLLASAPSYTHPENIHITWDMNMRVYGSAESAAIDGLRDSLKMMEPKRSVEYGGVVVEIPGHMYRYTIPVTNNFKAGIDLPGDYTLQLPGRKEPTLFVNGFPVVADFHTHPCYHEYLTDSFSPPDLARNNAYATDGYILDVCMGDVYRYDPHRDAQDAKHPWKGHIVAWLKEIAN